MRYCLTAARLLVGFGPVLITAACVSDGPQETDGTSTVDDTSPISVTVPPTRGTPFCVAMIDLSDTILGDREVDAKALIIETYRSIASEAPSEIAGDFAAVLTELETGVTAPTLPPVTQPTQGRPPQNTVPGTTTGAATATVADGSSEFFFGGSTPAERVNDYVAFACRDSENNPGPPATQPLVDAPDGG
ncbi:MAG: hypothetical protein ABIP17_06940 [Ilumatobacteraceae bacterium]